MVSPCVCVCVCTVADDVPQQDARAPDPAALNAKARLAFGCLVRATQLRWKHWPRPLPCAAQRSNADADCEPKKTQNDAKAVAPMVSKALFTEVILIVKRSILNISKIPTFPFLHLGIVGGLTS